MTHPPVPKNPSGKRPDHVVACAFRPALSTMQARVHRVIAVLTKLPVATTTTAASEAQRRTEKAWRRPPESSDSKEPVKPDSRRPSKVNVVVFEPYPRFCQGNQSLVYLLSWRRTGFVPSACRRARSYLPLRAAGYADRVKHTVPATKNKSCRFASTPPTHTTPRAATANRGSPRMG